MDFTRTLLEVIDFRSFSNVWFWIALAVAWSTASHWVLGVPFDLIARARRQGGAAMADVEDLARVNVGRLLHLSRTSGAWLIGVSAFLLTTLAALGWGYGVEMAQAVFLIALPMSGVGFLAIARAARIEAEAPTGEALIRHLARHRLWTQVVGMVAIFVTAMWGMYQNLAAMHGL